MMGVGMTTQEVLDLEYDVREPTRQRYVFR